jgi:hypothetical protein
MSHQAITALSRTLRGHVGLGRSRVETLCMLVVGMVGARTVNLSHIATEGGRSVLIASTCRRPQRFFQHVDLGPDRAVPVVARLVGPAGSRTLALDRTNWKIGTHDVNHLVLAVVTRRFRVPLFRTLLEGPGNSATATRIALLRRHLAHFPASSVRLLLADREFIGADRIKFLNDANIPFAIRLREDLRVTTEEGCDLTLFARLHRAGRTRFFQARLGAREDAQAHDAPLLNFAAKRLGAEWLIVVSNIPAHQALAACRERIRHCRSDQWRDNGSSSNACSATPRPAASTSRTPASPARANSPSSWRLSRSPSPGRGAPPPTCSGRARPCASPTATSPDPGSALASTGSETF